MRKPILFLAITSVVAMGAFSSCASEEDKLKSDKEEINNANEDIELAKEKYYQDMADYKEMNLEKIRTNEKSIAEFNKRILDQKQEAKADYLAKINALDQKNTDLKKKLDEFKETGKDNWESFKNEFNKDMEELGKAFGEFTHK
jgi:hypothetical protein